MSKTLIIVESPSKAEKIQGFLGKNYIVKACKGHICDLAKKGKFNLGIDIDNNFSGKYVLMDDKIDILNDLLKSAKIVDQIYLCSDPDIEGEKISDDLKKRLLDTDKPIKRVTFNEINKKAVVKALKAPRDINENLVKAQETRRMLDRIIGFIGSPLLMNVFESNLSCGRVQSVVTKMIIEKEQDIIKFKPETFYTISANLITNNNENIQAKVVSERITEDTRAQVIKSTIESNDIYVKNIDLYEEIKNPFPPLITSTMQRYVSKVYGIGAEDTMKAAQSLYENGYITYLRTDSVRASDEALEVCVEWLKNKNYSIPKKPNQYKNSEAAHDAHECIRPTDLDVTEKEITNPIEKKVYDLIWRYFISSQMIPAVYNVMKIKFGVQNSNIELEISGKALKTKGFLEILNSSLSTEELTLPLLSVNDILKLKGKALVEEKKTQPPARLTEYTLIKELEKRHIGRSSTYAEILKTIIMRKYVEKKGNIYYPTDLGNKVIELLNKYFTFMDYNFTTLLEQKLELIEHGKENNIDILKTFYGDFKTEIEKAYIGCGKQICDKCGSPIVKKKGKNDQFFFACSAYPSCKNIINSNI